MFARHPADLIKHVRHSPSRVCPDEDTNLGRLVVSIKTDGGKARTLPVLDGPTAPLRLIPGSVLSLGLVDDPEDGRPVPAGGAVELVGPHQVRLVSLA